MHSGHAATAKLFEMRIMFCSAETFAVQLSQKMTEFQSFVSRDGAGTASADSILSTSFSGECVGA